MNTSSRVGTKVGAEEVFEEQEMTVADEEEEEISSEVYFRRKRDEKVFRNLTIK